MKKPLPAGHDPTRPEYWRSLRRLAESQAVQEAGLGDEFPSHASQTPGGLSRRRMLRVMGASLALAGMAACRRPEYRLVPYAQTPEKLVPGVPQRYATAMPMGTEAAPLVVESHVGRPVKIEGNDLHPASQGTAGPWMQAALLDLYDPDRSRRPQRRGEDGSWEVSEWETFRQWAQENIIAPADSEEGRGLALLSPAYASPSLAYRAAKLKEKWPRMQWRCYESCGEENVLQGCAQVSGRPSRPLYHLEKARTVLALDCDFLQGGPQSVSSAAGWARSRRAEEGRDMSRLYAVEGHLSLTGANADHRIALPPSRIGGVLRTLARRISSRGLALEAPSGLPFFPARIERQLDLIAEELIEAGPSAAILLGRRHAPELHALLLDLHQALGAAGETLTLHEVKDSRWGGPKELEKMARAAQSGRISALLVLGGNPLSFSAN